MKFKTDNLEGDLFLAVEKLNQIQDFKNNFISNYSFEDNDTFIHPSHCLMKIETVKLDKPTLLFGNSFKTSLVNKLSIYQSVIDKKNPHINNRGKLLFESLITDSSLAEASFNHSNISPITYINVLGDSIDFNRHNEKQNTEQRIDSELNSDLKDFFNYISEIRNILNSNISKSQFPKSKAKEIAKNIDIITRNSSSNYLYLLSTLSKELTKDITEAKLEVNSVISKINFYKNSTTLLLENKKSEDFNLPLWLLNGSFSKQERLLLISFLQKIYSTSSLSSKIKEKINTLLNNIENLKNEKRDHLSGNEGFLKINSAGFGSDKFMQITIGSATSLTSNSKVYLTEIDSFAKFNLSYEDFLLLLRGNQQEELIPCKLESFCNVNIALDNKFITNKEDLYIKEAFNNSNYKNQKLFNLSEEIQSFLDKPIRNKNQKNQLLSYIEDFEIELEKSLKQYSKCFDKDKKLIIEEFKEKLKSSIFNNFENIPEHDKEFILKLIN